MYNKIWKISNYKETAFLILNVILWFVCVFLAGVLCAAVTGQNSFWLNPVLCAVLAAWGGGLCGGILFLYRKKCTEDRE